jgi:hypothetical protein
MGAEVQVEISMTGVEPWTTGLRADIERVRIKDANGVVLKDIKVVTVDGDDVRVEVEQS